MSVEYLTDEWMARYVEAGAELPARDGLNLITQYVVEKTPNGNVRWYDVVVDGRVAEASLGKHKEATLTVTWKYPYDVKMLSGELSAEAAFMQGRIKVEGDYPTWLYEWGDVLRSDEYRAFQAAVYADTAFTET